MCTPLVPALVGYALDAFGHDTEGVDLLTSL